MSYKFRVSYAEVLDVMCDFCKFSSTHVGHTHNECINSARKELWFLEDTVNAKAICSRCRMIVGLNN